MSELRFRIAMSLDGLVAGPRREWTSPRIGGMRPHRHRRSAEEPRLPNLFDRGIERPLLRRRTSALRRIDRLQRVESRRSMKRCARHAMAIARTDIRR